MSPLVIRGPFTTREEAIEGYYQAGREILDGIRTPAAAGSYRERCGRACLEVAQALKESENWRETLEHVESSVVPRHVDCRFNWT